MNVIFLPIARWLTVKRSAENMAVDDLATGRMAVTVASSVSWLNGKTIPPLHPDDIATFTSPPHGRVLSGPCRLYRFGRPQGRWWYGEQLMRELKHDIFQELYGQERVKRNASDALMHPRDQLAVTNDWNDFSLISVLTLPQGKSLYVYEGDAAPQKLFEKQTHQRTFKGGGTQILVYETASLPGSMIRMMPFHSFIRSLVMRGGWELSA